MPKRIIDGEALWGSDRIASVEPEWVRPEYANLIPLALSNGVFEFSVRRVWKDVYAYNRPSMTEKKVAIVLEALRAAKLLFVFQAEGKSWGFWTGIDRPGRLPSRERRGTHEKTGPEPPADLLQCFLTDTKGCHVDSDGILARASARPEPKPNPKPDPNPTEEGSEVSLPQWVPQREWLDFVAMRLNIRKPIKTASQAHYCLRQLESLRAQGNDVAAVLSQSIAANWQGLFPVKSGANNANKSVADQTRRNAAIALERIEQREARAAAAGGAGRDSSAPEWGSADES